MEINKNIDILDNKYIIIEQKGHGGTADVYLVQDKDTKAKYAAKILNSPKDNINISKCFEREKSMLEKVSSPYIIKLIASGEGELIMNGEKKGIKKYLILEYASKGELFDYMKEKNGLGEEKGGFLFYKILQGIQECHKKGICHRDIKLQNILLDGNFNPKIADFGFATSIKDENENTIFLHSGVGTPSHIPPEILQSSNTQGYKGDKADVFSLGVVLMNLVTCRYGFINAVENDPYYGFIYKKKTASSYWAAVRTQINGVTNEFKNLFIRMVSKNPMSRPSIDDILNKDAWLKKIREMNQTQKEILEKEIQEEFLKRK